MYNAFIKAYNLNTNPCLYAMQMSFYASFITLKYDFGVHYYMKSEIAHLVTRRGTHFHVKFISKRRE